MHAMPGPATGFIVNPCPVFPMDRPEYLWSTEGLLSMLTILLALLVINLTSGSGGLTPVLSLLTALAILLLVIGRLLFTETVEDVSEELGESGGDQSAEGESVGSGDG